eukprot:XP_014619038.1 glucan endo-1,3-beta-glucosidase [Glycine max]
MVGLFWIFVSRIRIEGERVVLRYQCDGTRRRRRVGIIGVAIESNRRFFFGFRQSLENQRNKICLAARKVCDYVNDAGDWDFQNLREVLPADIRRGLKDCVSFSERLLQTLFRPIVSDSIGAQFQSVGVCYGGKGNNLPKMQAVVDLYKSNRIDKIRLYHPDEGALQALRGSNIELVTNSLAGSVLPALENIQNAISAANLQCQVKVSTAIDTTLLGYSYPPNVAVFSSSASSYIRPIVNFLARNGAPLLANVYPYFAYVNDQQSISLDYALFTEHGNNEAGYQNLFDALLDSLYAALEKVGAPNVTVVVSESGWPSEGGAVAATVQNAGTYYRNLISHAKGGTPKRPNGPIEIYLYAMFDENQKQGQEIQQHFGLFRLDKSPVPTFEIMRPNPKFKLNF